MSAHLEQTPTDHKDRLDQKVKELEGDIRSVHTKLTEARTLHELRAYRDMHERLEGLHSVLDRMIHTAGGLRHRWAQERDLSAPNSPSGARDVDAKLQRTLRELDLDDDEPLDDDDLKQQHRLVGTWIGEAIESLDRCQRLLDLSANGGPS